MRLRNTLVDARGNAPNDARDAASAGERVLTRVQPNDETADDEHLEGLGPLTEGEQQSGEDGEAVVHQQCPSPGGGKERGGVLLQRLIQISYSEQNI